VHPPARIRDDLRGLFRGPLAFDAAARAVYAADASPFEIIPHAVATPLDDADLRTLVEYAHANALPLIPRGSGTGLAGEALGAGVVVDMSVHFRAILDTGPDWVRVQPGVTPAELAVALSAHGRRFAVEPHGNGARTLGGMAATNACGPNAHRHGYTHDHIRALKVLFDTGEAAHVLAPGVPAAAFGLDALPDRGPRFIELRAETAALIAEHRDLIQLTRPHTRFNRCGYILHDILAPAGLDLVKLLVGSEGTLALFTELTLATIPAAGGAGKLVLGFSTVDAAVRAGLTLWGVDGLAGCELLDQRLLALARPASAADGIGQVPPEVGAALILSVECDSPAAAADTLRDVAYRMRGTTGCAVLAGPAASPEGLACIDRFRRAAVGGLAATGRGPRPVTGFEDIAVPAEELPRFLPHLRAVLRQFDVSAVVMVHVLAGQVDARPLLDLDDPADRAKFWPLAEAVHARVLALGGTVSTAHGTGLARTPWVEKQYGPLVPVFRELKRVYDPKGVLNPGKIVGPDPSRPAWPLRPAAAAPERVPLLHWTAGQVADQVADCNGCGDCRTRTDGRMCPVFRAVGTEQASPRAKAVLVRAALGGGVDAPKLDSPEARAVAALCVHCKMCPRECRGRVDVPKLMLEAKATHHAEHGLDRTDWVMARIEGFAAVAGQVALTSNLLLRTRPARWLIEKLFGLSRRRCLPRLAHRTFLRRARRAGLSRRPSPPSRGSSSGAPRVKVVYFVDHFANRHDPSIGQATVAVLAHQGVEVHVPWRQRGSGLAPLVQGDIETAREAAAYNIRTLAGLIRDGYRVVCSEPTAAVVLTQEYLDLLDSPDAKLVAANTVELTTLLWELHRQGDLRTDFQRLDVNLGHHVPCHIKSLGQVPAGPELLRLIPGVQVYTIDAGCSGMAGPYGLRADAYDDSLAAGRALFEELARPRVIYGSTECGTCRLQMQEGAGKRTLHPVQYLALAYGLMPELRARLAKPLGRLVD